MLRGITAHVLRHPGLRASYMQVRQSMELLPRQLRYRRAHRAPAPQEVRDAVAALKRDGLVVLPEFVDPQVVAEMRQVIEEAIAQRRYRYDGDTFAFQEPPSDPRAIARLNLLDITWYSPRFVEYAVNDTIVQIVNAYLGLESIIGGVVAYRTQPTSTPPKGAFLWHYDNAPLQVKAICYLTEVTDADGPFGYVRGTQGKRPLEVGYEETRFDETAVPTEGRMACVGKPGTVLIVDTTGIHRAIPNTRGIRDVVSVLYDASVGARRSNFYNLPVPSHFLRALRPDQRRLLRIPEHAT